jgi:hypothetical protein
MVTNQILTDALTEINAVDVGGTPAAELTTYALSKLNRIWDNWNAMRHATYYETFIDNLLIIPNQEILTIGPDSADYTVTQRPVTLDGANVILNNVTPNVKTALEVVRYPWWLTQSVPETTTELPNFLYYEPKWPNGEIRLWPLPTYAYGLELMVRGVLAQLTQFAEFTMPPGYQDALTLTLAEDLSGPLEKMWTPLQAQKAQQARARVFANNDLTPRIATQDAGMPSAGLKPRPYFNWRSGFPI